MTREQTFKRDQLIIEFIRQHKGLNNAVSTKQVSDYIYSRTGRMYSSTTELIRNIIVKYNLPICSSNGKGYYWPVNAHDIQHTVNHLTKRINFMLEHIAILNGFIVK